MLAIKQGFFLFGVCFFVFVAGVFFWRGGVFVWLFFLPRTYLEVVSSRSAATRAMVMTRLVSFGGSC